MTKAKMIETIQKNEASLYLRLQELRSYDIEQDFADRALRKWVAVSELMESLGIGIDYSLPDNEKAREIIRSQRELKIA